MWHSPPRSRGAAARRGRMPGKVKTTCGLNGPHGVCQGRSLDPQPHSRDGRSEGGNFTPVLVGSMKELGNWPAWAIPRLVGRDWRPKKLPEDFRQDDCFKIVITESMDTWKGRGFSSLCVFKITRLAGNITGWRGQG